MRRSRPARHRELLTHDQHRAAGVVHELERDRADHHARERPVPLVAQHDEHVSLNPDLVTVDYWQLNQAEHDRHLASTDDDRYAAWSRIAAVYRGEIAEGMSALWL